MHSTGDTGVNSMRAARLYGPGQPLRIERTPVPRPGLGEALIRVRAAGMCHTELHMLDGVLNLGVTPLTPGHEVVGEVVETRLHPSGCDDAPALEIGQRVVLYYYAPCGRCRYCASGIENLCPNVARQLGFTADGGYAEFLVAPTRSLVPLPDTLSDEEAVGLACGGATAFHAARDIARVQPGETAVVYGVGGVGFYLLQICKLAGAKVIAIGRTPEKLKLALGLGADACVNAVDDPLAAVYDLAGGDGADTVFDMVASAETMSIAPRMLARRGKLVFAGYSGEPFRVPPLWLVLRELQVLGSVGHTLANLRETVRLAEAGQLHGVTGTTFPLEQINEALAALRAGTIVGRAVIKPCSVQGNTTAVQDGLPAQQPGSVASYLKVAQDGLRTRNRDSLTMGDANPRPQSQPLGFGPQSDAECHRAAYQRMPEQSDPPAGDRIAVHNDPRSPGKVETPGPQSKPFRIGYPLVGEQSHLGSNQPPGSRPFEAELLDLIGRGVDATVDDDEFNRLALGIFAYQYEHNIPYRAFCDYRGVGPERVTHWSRFPAAPIGAFKETTLVTEPPDQAAALFLSSGTTLPEQRSRHYHPTLAVYDASTSTNFKGHVLPDIPSMRCLILNPPPESLPNSSLAYYLGLMARKFGDDGSGYFVDDAGLRYDALLDALRAARDQRSPVALLGTTFAFVHLLDRMAIEGERLALPEGSRVFDTGGVKGRSREIALDELEAALVERLGVPPDFQVNMYGLTELSTQFIDASLRDHVRGRPGSRYKTVPPWSRTRILDPESLDPVARGTPGVLCHTDLANRSSVCTILTEDMGVESGDGFEIIGRVKGSQARGCSIAMDELLIATGRRS